MSSGGGSCWGRLRELGVDSEEQACRLALLAARALSPVLSRLGVSTLSCVDYFEVDPEGPRIIVRLAGGGLPSLDGFRVEEAYVDMSPDGVEVTVTVATPGGVDSRALEEAVASAIEEGEVFEGISEFDVSVAGGRVTVTLTGRLLSELPSLLQVLEAVRSAFEAVS